MTFHAPQKGIKVEDQSEDMDDPQAEVSLPDMMDSSFEDLGNLAVHPASWRSLKWEIFPTFF